MRNRSGTLFGKIFGIGLPRTGTSSLTVALELLGFQAVHYPSFRFRYGKLGAALGFDEVRLTRIDLEFEALTDLPVLSCYRRLDAAFPGSRFIVTVRDKEAWLRSCERFPQFAPDYVPRFEVRALRKAVFGEGRLDRAHLEATYDRHHDEVHSYFAGRRQDLLVLDISAGEGWDRLNPFLGLEVPDAPFPWENAADRANEGATPDLSPILEALERSRPPGPELAARSRGNAEFARALRALSRGDLDSFTGGVARAVRLVPKLSTSSGLVLAKLHRHAAAGNEPTGQMDLLTAAASAWPERDSPAAVGLRLYAAQRALRKGRIRSARDLLRGISARSGLRALERTSRALVR